ADLRARSQPRLLLHTGKLAQPAIHQSDPVQGRLSAGRRETAECDRICPHPDLDVVVPPGAVRHLRTLRTKAPVVGVPRVPCRVRGAGRLTPRAVHTDRPELSDPGSVRPPLAPEMAAGGGDSDFGMGRIWDE